MGASDAPMGHTDQHRGVTGPLHMIESLIGSTFGPAAAGHFRHCRVGFTVPPYSDAYVTYVLNLYKDIDFFI